MQSSAAQTATPGRSGVVVEVGADERGAPGQSKFAIEMF